jgi:hypothetical protein
VDRKIKVWDPELTLSKVERREGELGGDVDPGRVAVCGAGAARLGLAEGLGASEGGKSESELGEGVDGVGLADGDEERRGGGGDSVSSVDLVGLVGSRGIGTAGGAKSDVVGTVGRRPSGSVRGQGVRYSHLNDPREEELVPAVE